jgi:hypothetical protein
VRRKVYSHGDERVISKFLLFPLTIRGEWRWLERAFIRQRRFETYVGDGWDNVNWESTDQPAATHPASHLGE